MAEPSSVAPRRGRVARHALLNLTGQALPALVGFATVPVMVRGLGTEAYGAFALAWVLLGYFTLFDLGLGRATTRFVAADVARGALGSLRRLVRTALVMQSLLGVAGAVILAALTPWLGTSVISAAESLEPEIVLSFFLLAGALPFVLATATLAGVLEGLRRFELLNAVRVPASLAVLIFPAIAVLSGGGLRASVLALIAARVGGAIAFALVVHRALPPRGAAIPEEGLVRRMLHFGSWITVSNVVSPLMVYSDRFVLGARVGLSGVAYYSAPYDVITRLWLVPSSLTSVLFPEFSGLAATADRAASARLVRRATRALFLVMGAIVLVAVPLAHVGLSIWLGADFADQATTPARLLLVGMLVNVLAWVPMAYLQGVGRPDLPAKSHLAQLPLYAAVLWYLVGAWGTTGAALAWLLRVSVDAIVLFVLTARHLRTRVG